MQPAGRVARLKMGGKFNLPLFYVRKNLLRALFSKAAPKTPDKQSQTADIVKTALPMSIQAKG